MPVPIEEYFRYHPPKSQERIDAHNAINNAALEFAKVIQQHVTDEQLLSSAIQSVQYARMISNQAITVQEVNS